MITKSRINVLNAERAKAEKDWKLLTESIEHWKKDIRDNTRRVMPDTCPLCREYLLQEEHCDNCPISKDSGGYCAGLIPDDVEALRDAFHRAEGPEIKALHVANCNEVIIKLYEIRDGI